LFSLEAVFSEVVPVIRSVMEGFDVCIFASGPTRTKKTFTMEGVLENKSVNYRVLKKCSEYHRREVGVLHTNFVSAS